MIPEGDRQLSPAEAARWKLTRDAYALARDGVPVEQIVADAREGAERGSRRRHRT